MVYQQLLPKKISSFLYRIRSGERHPSNLASFCESISSYVADNYSLTLVIFIHVILLMLITFVLYRILMKIGPKEYRKLNI